jgi:GNAT superfamily N-acetyltransferase
VRIRPAEPRGGIGRLQLRIDGDTLADLDLAICGPCRRAVLEQVRVDEDHRRFGYGRVLVAAALALAPPSEYSWSTTTIRHDDIVVRAFWSSVDWPGTLGDPHYCTDMERAAGRLPDW